MKKRLSFVLGFFLTCMVNASDVEDSQRFDVYTYLGQIHVDYTNGGGANQYLQEGIRFIGTLQASDIVGSLAINLNGFSKNVFHRNGQAQPPNVDGDPCINTNIVDARTGEVFLYDTINKTFAEDLSLEGTESSILLVGGSTKDIGFNCEKKNPGSHLRRFGFFVLARPEGLSDPIPASELEEYLADGTNPWGLDYSDIEYMLSRLFSGGSYLISGDGEYEWPPRIEDLEELTDPPCGYPYGRSTEPVDCSTCREQCIEHAGAENGSLKVTVPVRDGIMIEVKSDVMKTDYYDMSIIEIPDTIQFDYVYQVPPNGTKISEIYTGTELCTFDAHGTGGLSIKVYGFPQGSVPDASGSYRYLIDPVSLKYEAELDAQNGGSVVDVKLVNMVPYAKTRYKQFAYLTNLEGVTGKNGWLFSHLSNDQNTTLQANLKTVYDSIEVGIEYQTITERIVDPLAPTDTSKYLSFRETKYRKFVLGGEDHWLPVTKLNGWGVNQETTSYEYEETGVNTGLLSNIRFPDGNWERYVYDPIGRITRHVRSYLNNDWTNNSEAANRVTEYDYAPHAGDNGKRARIARTVTEKVLGIVTSRTYTINGDGVVRTERAHSNTASVGDTANLVTTTYEDSSRMVTFLPDGRVQTRQVSTQLDYEVITTAIGKPTQAGSPVDVEVEKGDITVLKREIGEDRRLVSSYQYRRTPGVSDILTGGYAASFDNDPIGDPRASSMQYFDGTSVIRNYSCCGLESMTSRNGVTTSYEYDEMDRRLQSKTNGVITHTEYDLAGRVKFTYQTPENDLNDILGKSTSAPEYNVLGELEKTYDAVGRETEYDRAVSSGIITQTTTRPGGSTSITKTYADGTPIETLGTAARAMKMTVIWDSAGQRMTTEAYTANTNEFTRTTADFLGRTIKTEKPSPSGTGVASIQTIYEAGTGRMIETLDEALLRTIYQYNDLNEREVVAIDVNNNGQIDLGGTDQVTSNVVEYVDYTFNNVTYPTRKTSSYVWQEDNSSTSTLVSESWTTHDVLNTWSESFGQLSRSETVRDVPNAKVTTTRTSPDGSYIVSIAEDGLAKSTTTYDVNAVQLTQMTYGYDQYNRQNTVTDAGTGTTTTTFHADGSVNSVTTPDPDGTGPLSAQVTTSWSSGLNSLGYTGSGGQIMKVTTADNKTVTREYFPTGELQKHEGARQYPVEYTYDYAGRMKTMKTWQDKVGNTGTATTTWNYNDAGVMTSKRYDDNKGPDYEYDVRGLMEKRTWARGKVTNYGYDSRRRLETIEYPASTTISVTNKYDRLGRLIEVEDASGKRSYDHGAEFLLEKEEYIAGILNGWEIGRGYDPLRRPDEVELLEASTSKHKVEYGYTGASWLETVTGHGLTNEYSYVVGRTVLDELDQGGVQTVDRDWDNLNRLTDIQTDNGTSTLSSHAYEYNNANQRTKATLNGGNFWEYDYDDLGQVILGVKKDSGGTALDGYTFGYGFDDIGNRKTSTENGRTTEYTPNLLNQYTEIDRPAFANLRGDRSNTNTTIEVDLLGDGNPAVHADYNLLLWHKELAINSLVSQFQIVASEGGNRNSATGSLYTPNGAEVPEYDDDGNLTRDHLWTYTWNSENCLVVQEHRNDITLTPLTRKKMEYSYDSQGRRFQRKTYAEVSGSWVLQEDLRFIYDGWNLLAEIDAADVIVRDYVWGLDLSGSMEGAGGVGGLLSVDDATTVGLSVYDGNGNVMGYTDSSSGTFVAMYEYDPFGKLILSLGSRAASFVHKFSTKYLVEESGCYYYGFRYYDPDTGRWLNRDPIEEEGGYNLYGFVGNNVLNKWDIFGLEWSDPDRKRDNHRANVTGEVGDTIEDLAKKINLDPDEYEKWLLPVGEAELPASSSEKLKGRCTFSVPNEVVITYGDLRTFTSNIAGPVLDNMNVLERKYTRKGYYVFNFKNRIPYIGWKKDAIQRAVARPNLAVWAHGGHGTHEGISVISPIDSPDSTHTHLREDLKSEDLRPHHKLSEIILYSCFQGRANLVSDWQKNIAPGGVLHAYPFMLSAGRTNGTRWEWLEEYTVPEE